MGGRVIEKNGRQRIRNKEHQATQKQVECMQQRGSKGRPSTTRNATLSRQGCSVWWWKLNFWRIISGGMSLGNRQYWNFGRNHHGGALVIWRRRSPWKSFGFVTTKVTWNQRPLHHPVANWVHLHKEVNGTTWQLVLESCSNKDSTPLPNSVGTKRDASGWDWSFLFSMKLWAMG